MNEFKNSRFTKTVSLAIAFFTFFSFTFTDLAQALQNKSQLLETRQADLPLQYGKVMDIYRGSAGKEVFLIQDLHCQPEAQRNIARILKDLSEKYEFAKVAMEGSFGKIDTSLLSTIPDKNVRESVAGFFMEKGLLSGTEYAGATSDDSLELQGIENESLYRKDREILESAYTREDEVKNFFKPFKQDVDKELQKILNQELKQFRASLKKEKAASSHIDDLISEANSLQVDLNEYPVLSAFAQMMALKAEIDFARVSRETDYFINLLRKVLSAGQIGILISLRRNEARADQFYSALRQFFLSGLQRGARGGEHWIVRLRGAEGLQQVGGLGRLRHGRHNQKDRHA